ncbi:MULTISPECIES: TolC family protein [unclassified Zunongwangia]|uniref:TolC family protein n=1 Tax=unclassified Zunongwangia TaxID=2632541 RepID=UPI0022DD7896|nr:MULTISPECIES: TolC family protein [unclassified Zunongwangia]WBL21995.1 TolC family protein [Zunongwangia sp. HRR-M8]WBL26052.1 TolC family protein [Zunongwangia sp. HGR-M22]
MKKFSFLTILLFVGFITNAQEKKWTLQECVEYALEHNISVKQSELDVEASEIDKKDAIGNLLPAINGNASNSWNTGLTQNVTTGVLQNQTTRNFSAGVTASINLFDGLRNYKQLQRAKLAKLSAQYSLDKMQDDITLNVANSYLQVLFAKQDLEVLKSQNEVTQEQLERTQQLVDAGSLPRGDLLEIKATDADERQRIIVAQNNIRISLISLAQMLLIKDYENFDIVEYDYDIFGAEILNNSVYDIIERAKEERSEIKIAEANKEIAQQNVEIARGAYMPTLGAFVNYNTRETGANRIEYFDPPGTSITEIGYVESTGEPVVTETSDPAVPTVIGPRPFIDQLWLNDGISYGFQLSVPVFNGFSTRNQVRRSQVDARRAEYQLEQAELDLEANVYQAYVDASGAFEAYEAALVAAESQEQANEYATERYDVGLTNAFDFSQSKLRFENAQREVIRAKYDYIFKLKVLELYFGVPVSDLRF